MTTATYDVVQSLWIGKITEMERLCIRSFLANGHPFHLYAYDDENIDQVPEGTIVKCANEIIPWSQAFKVRGGYSSFSDFFRWKLILDRGGWWADADTVCLRPFSFECDHVFVGGTGQPGSDDCISSGMFKAPAGAAVLKWGWEQCQKMDPATMSWGEAGPPLITAAVHKLGLIWARVPAKLFFPVHYTPAPQIFCDANAPVIPSKCYSVHLFNEMWRLAGYDKDAKYPDTSLYEQLKRRFS